MSCGLLMALERICISTSFVCLAFCLYACLFVCLCVLSCSVASSFFFQLSVCGSVYTTISFVILVFCLFVCFVCSHQNIEVLPEYKFRQVLSCVLKFSETVN